MGIYSPGLLCIGYPGKKAAAELVQEHETELLEVFPEWLLRQVQQSDFDREDSLEAVAKVLAGAADMQMDDKLPAMLFPVTEGGLFGSLWELGETLGCGISVNLADVPMQQSVIEICNYYHCNPYESDDKGVCLLVCRDAAESLRRLQEAGLEAGVIGRLTPGPDRIVRVDSQIRYLNPLRK